MANRIGTRGRKRRPGAWEVPKEGSEKKKGTCREHGGIDPSARGNESAVQWVRFLSEEICMSSLAGCLHHWFSRLTSD